MNTSSSTAVTRSPSTAFLDSTEVFPSTKRSKTEMLSRSHQQSQSCNSSCFEADSSDVISIIHTMQHQENTVYRPCDYLDGTDISPQDRMDVCRWGFQIVDAVEVDRSVAVIAITYFDRFLSCRGLRVVEVCLCRKREFQLAFITCFIIALKGREGMGVTPNFVAETLCDGMYHPEEIVNMEVEVLRSLGWRLNGPTPFDFIHYFMELLPSSADERIAELFAEETAKKAEVAMLDYSMAIGPLSGVALVSVTSLMNSLDSRTRQKLGEKDWMNRIASVLRVHEYYTCDSMELTDELEQIATRYVSADEKSHYDTYSRSDSSSC